MVSRAKLPPTEIHLLVVNADARMSTAGVRLG